MNLQPIFSLIMHWRAFFLLRIHAPIGYIPCISFRVHKQTLCTNMDSAPLSDQFAKINHEINAEIPKEI